MTPPTSGCWASSDRKSTRLNSSHPSISYAVFCLKKKNKSHYSFLIEKHKKKQSNKRKFYNLSYLSFICFIYLFFFFFFNDTATTEIYTLSLHDALPIWVLGVIGAALRRGGARDDLAPRLHPSVVGV